ncbi:MBOAT family O-acyltransferase [Peptoniphilus lacrimalis]|uniref:MBOAT family O-acyltransferase n=1 Tax=Peptoniphilus lacrimalis TaxID=33031 RepID=UPI002550438D|nr:MBOAT family O-acyltransferase [Peptoniphilus lacrimalis]
MEKKKSKVFLSLVLLLNFGLLGLVKFTSFSLFKNIIPLGISFYIFMATSYVIDIYRKKYKAQRNIFKYALFVSFFPQMVQGPIGRYDELEGNLYGGNSNSRDISYGLLLILFGYFKKLVIADRASILTAKVFSSPDEFSGIFVFIAIIFYSIQIYGDFSGGIDVARGVAYLFGIKLPENFKRPFFADSLTDYWRRWHITLGAWMRDYVFYPLSLSRVFAYINKKSRRTLGRKFGKYLTLSISTFVVYFIIGIWHGAGLNFIVFGIYNGLLITLGLLFEDNFKKIKDSFGISPTSKALKLFQIIRTSLLVFIGRYFTRSENLSQAIFMLKKTFTDRNFRFGQIGLKASDYLILFVSVLILFIISYSEEKNIDVKEKILEFRPYWQFVFIFLALAYVLYFGIFSSNFTAVDFIYRNY